jgi:hypothetical protein
VFIFGLFQTNARTRFLPHTSFLDPRDKFEQRNTPLNSTRMGTSANVLCLSDFEGFLEGNNTGHGSLKKDNAILRRIAAVG